MIVLIDEWTDITPSLESLSCLLYYEMVMSQQSTRPRRVI